MVLQVPEADPLTHADVNVVNVVDPCAVASTLRIDLIISLIFTHLLDSFSTFVAFLI